MADKNVTTLPGMPPPPEPLAVTISGSDTWLGLSKAMLGKLKVGQTFLLTVEAHITSEGIREAGSDDEIRFIKLKTDFIDTDEARHGSHKRIPPEA